MLAAAGEMYRPVMANPSGVLFFIHGANETAVGLAGHVARIEDQVRARGWDVTVVAPEWRRHSGLRLGNWKGAIHRRGGSARFVLRGLASGPSAPRQPLA